LVLGDWWVGVGDRGEARLKLSDALGRFADLSNSLPDHKINRPEKLLPWK